MRKFYSDNAKKILQNKIFNLVYLECYINEKTQQDYFEESFSKNIDDFELDEHGLFSVSNCFSDEEKTESIEQITGSDVLEDIIKKEI